MYRNTVCHAVLAFLSERYPPLEGRSPTCYSPVCHSTYGLLHFRVRLACVRHAASVDSEPGSNSQVKFAVLPHPCGCGRCNCLTQVSLFKLALSDCVTSCVSVVRLGSPRFDLRLSRTRLAPPTDTRRVVCLHVLSSFQRTESYFRPPHARSFALRGTFQLYDPNSSLSMKNLHFIELSLRCLPFQRSGDLAATLRPL